jgi:hypothetical protein
MPQAGDGLPADKDELMNDRQLWKANSNNWRNPNKNLCGLAVAKACHVADKVRYLHTLSDLKRALRHYYSVRSIMWCVNKATRNGKASKTVGGVRAALKKQLQSDDNLMGIVISVKGHVLLLGKDGQTIVDTDPRDRDRRPVLSAIGIFKKKGFSYE